MLNPRASTDRRAHRQSQWHREPPRHVPQMPTSTGHRQTTRQDPNLGYDYLDVRRRAVSWSAVTVIVLVLAANAVAVTGAHLPPFTSVVGFWFILLYPVYLVYTTSFWPTRAGPERLGYSLAAVLLLLILMGLAFNSALPSLGIQRPLGPLPVAVLGDGIVLSLVLLRRRRR